MRQDVSCKIGVRSQGCRTANLPEDIAQLSTIDWQYTGIARRSKSASYLENKDTRGIPLTVKRELSCQLS
jgi:hypothetical protein